MGQMFGRAAVNVDGQQLLVDDASKLNLGGVKRNVVKGIGVYGFAEETAEAMVEVNVFIDKTSDLDALNAIDDATIMFRCDTGQSYVLSHAWLMEPVEATAATSGGKTPLKFCAAKAEKL